jgi:hypothetical protein
VRWPARSGMQRRRSRRVCGASAWTARAWRARGERSTASPGFAPSMRLRLFAAADGAGRARTSWVPIADTANPPTGPTAALLIAPSTPGDHGRREASRRCGRRPSPKRSACWPSGHPLSFGIHGSEQALSRRVSRAKAEGRGKPRAVDTSPRRGGQEFLFCIAGTRKTDVFPPRLRACGFHPREISDEAAR